MFGVGRPGIPSEETEETQAGTRTEPPTFLKSAAFLHHMKEYNTPSGSFHKCQHC